MYFGDFLVKNKIISVEDLLNALCYQIESLPSMFRIINESKIVPPADILNILKSHIKQDIDIVEVLLKEKKLTQDQVNELSLKQLSFKAPLGASLVKLKVLKEDQLQSLLASYFEEKNNTSNNSAASDKAASNDVSDAALESLKELGIDISQFQTSTSANLKEDATIAIQKRAEVESFLDVFNEKLKNKILKLIELTDESLKNGNDLSNYFNSLFRDIHMLKGAASFADIHIFESFLTDLDLLLDNVLSSAQEEVMKNWCKVHLAHLQIFINEFWSLRIEIQTHQSDLGLTQEHSGILKCTELVNNMK